MSVPSFQITTVAKILSRSIGIVMYDKLPNVENLEFVRKVSIRLEAREDIEEAVNRFVVHKNSDFKPVRFFIIDENDGRPIYVAELKPEVGFKVYDADENTLTMRITLPNETEGCLGKIKHPTGATIYKIFKRGHFDLDVVKMVSEKQNVVLKITQSESLYLTILKCIGFTFSDSLYSIKVMNRTLAQIRPNISTNVHNEHLVIKFPTWSNTQTRAISIGVGLLLTLEILYPQLKNLLKETIDEHKW